MATIRSSSKYSNKPDQEDGYTFDSRAERRRYRELRLMEYGGAIRDLQVHPRYPLVVNGVKVADYEADFAYVDCETGQSVIEDVKSPPTKTQLYRLKKKLMAALYGITIAEVTA